MELAFAQQNLKKILNARLTLLYDEQGKPLFLFGPVQLPMKVEDKSHTFKWYVWLKSEDLPEDPEQLIEELPYKNLAKHQQSSVLVYGDMTHAEKAAVRIHSICHTGDIFGSERCDCGSQFKSAIQDILHYGAGALLYLADHEGRGIGLFSKAMTYALQEEGLDTAEANLALGFTVDQRNYHDAVLVLKHFRKKPIHLLTNNPDKLEFLSKSNVKIKRVEKAKGEVSEHNRSYLETKIKEFNHTISRNEINM